MGGLLKDRFPLLISQNAEHLPVLKKGLTEMFGCRPGATAANPPQSPFKKGEVCDATMQLVRQLLFKKMLANKTA